MASISTPVGPVVLAVAVIVIAQRPSSLGSAVSVKEISTLVKRMGWHMGIKSGVFFAPITPATWATASTSPLAIFPCRIFSRVSS